MGRFRPHGMGEFLVGRSEKPSSRNVCQGACSCESAPTTPCGHRSTRWWLHHRIRMRGRDGGYRRLSMPTYRAVGHHAADAVCDELRMLRHHVHSRVRRARGARPTRDIAYLRRACLLRGRGAVDTHSIFISRCKTNIASKV